MEDVDVDVELLISLVEERPVLWDVVFFFLNISNIGRAGGPVCP